MEEIIVALIVAMAALYLFGRLRKALSGKGGCGCGSCRTMPKRTLPTACSGCTSQQCGSCSKEISRIG